MRKDFHKITEKKTGNQGAYQRISLFSWNSRSGWLLELCLFFGSEVLACNKILYTNILLQLGLAT